MEMLEFGFQIYDQNQQLVTVSTSSSGPPSFPRWMALIYRAVSARGGCLDAPGKLHSWVKGIPVFTDVEYAKLWVPSSPWLEGTDPATKRLNTLGALMTEDIKVCSFAFASRNSDAESFFSAIPAIRATTVTE